MFKGPTFSCEESRDNMELPEVNVGLLYTLYTDLNGVYVHVFGTLSLWNTMPFN